MYKVVIIEDDPMVAQINQTYAERGMKLDVDRVFFDGVSALEYLRKNTADLLILDYYLPGLDGKELLRTLRSEGQTMDVIIVTASGGCDHINEFYSLGIIDYLIKPFQYERFQAALNRFLLKAQVLSGEKPKSQETIDKFFFTSGEDDAVFLEKGIQTATLERVKAFLSRRPGEKLTVDVISENVGLSRVTVRRYMNYLTNNNIVINNVDYTTGGRPSSVYTYIG